jgi:hypothetical protein
MLTNSTDEWEEYVWEYAEQMLATEKTDDYDDWN